jgi:hypothetical protein
MSQKLELLTAIELMKFYIGRSTQKFSSGFVMFSVLHRRSDTVFFYVQFFLKLSQIVCHHFHENMLTQKRFLEPAFCIFPILKVMTGLWVHEVEPQVLHQNYRIFISEKENCKNKLHAVLMVSNGTQVSLIHAIWIQDEQKALSSYKPRRQNKLQIWVGLVGHRNRAQEQE